MTEQSALQDPNNGKMEEVRNGDQYARGLTVEDAYRHLANAPMTPISVPKIELH